MSDSEPGATSDVTPDPGLGDDATGTVERTDPQAVLADWFDDAADSIADLVDELVAAYETPEDDDEGDEATRRPRSDDLAETAVETVRRYLRNREAEPGRTDPRQAMTDWFPLADAHQELPQPFTMLTVAFATSVDEHSSSGELADIAVDTIQRYLRDCAAEVDG